MDPTYGHDPGPGVRPGDIFGSIEPPLCINELRPFRQVASMFDAGPGLYSRKVIRSFSFE